MLLTASGQPRDIDAASLSEPALEKEVTHQWPNCIMIIWTASRIPFFLMIATAPMGLFGSLNRASKEGGSSRKSVCSLPLFPWKPGKCYVQFHAMKSKSGIIPKSFSCILCCVSKGKNMHWKDVFNLKPASEHLRSMWRLIKLCSIDFCSQVHRGTHFSSSNDAEAQALLWSTLIFTWSLREDSDLMNCKQKKKVT